MTRAILVTIGLLLALPLEAQHPLASSSGYDPAVPTPKSVLGYQVSDRFTPHHLLMRYAERVAAASRRVRLDTMAVTVEGREALLVIITSEANQPRLDAIRQDAARLAAGGADGDAAAARMPAIVWLAYTVHGGEASGTEAAIAMIYQLAAGTDAETRMILDSTVVLIEPVQNPDGHERHVQDVLRRLSPLGPVATPGALVYGSNWPGARTSHWHFDLNRDWFIQSHPETRGRTATFLEWWPHVAVDLHEMGSNSTYFFAPPMEPVNKNVHQSIRTWWDIYARANAAAFSRHGWSFFTREGYDEFYPGYGVSWPILTGAVGMTFEQASSGPGAIRRTDGTVLTLRQAAWQHYTAAWATTLTTAQRRAERVRDYVMFRRTAVSEPPRDGVRGVAIARDAYGRADSLFRVLLGNRIAVRRIPEGATIRAVAYGTNQAESATLRAGGYLVDYAQPQGRLARALLEPDAQLDSTFIREELERRRTGQPNRFYDVTAWSLPFAFGLQAWTLTTLPPGAEPAGELPRRSGEVARAGYGYVFAPGSEASLRLLAGLLRDSVRVWFAPKAFRIGPVDFPEGAFVVRVAANDTTVHQRVRDLAARAGARVASLGTGMAD
ncbi:MAG: M14 family zinc carboxypeptidase, partial [Gemmatimonadales bacterium]